MYMYMAATTAAAVASLAWYTYNYWSQGTVPAIDLKANDLQLVTHGAFQGALHIQGLDDILYCVNDKSSTV